jgi:hypothetical protein
VTRNLRQAIDAAFAAIGKAEGYRVSPRWQAELAKVAEGAHVTLGAYNRPWR